MNNEFFVGDRADKINRLVGRNSAIDNLLINGVLVWADRSVALPVQIGLILIHTSPRVVGQLLMSSNDRPRLV